MTPFISSRGILSSMIMSAPASSASRAPSKLVTSTSILMPAGTLALARRTASPTPPTIAMWLSLMRTISDRLILWLTPPPCWTAYFSRARRTGVVFRVSRTRVFVPSKAFTKRRVSRGDPGEALEEVQGRALALEKGDGVALESGQDVSGLELPAVLDLDIERDLGIDLRKDEPGQPDPRQDPALPWPEGRPSKRNREGSGSPT